MTTFMKAKNLAWGQLAAGISSTALELTLLSGQGALFPSTFPFPLVGGSEIFSCTNRSGDVFTIVREQEGTSAAIHPAGTWIELNITAKYITDLNAAVNALENSELIARTTGDVTNATTNFADITGLTFPMLANKDYVIEAWIIFQSNTAATGIKFALNGPASPVAVVMLAHIPIGLTLYASDSCLASRAYNTGTPSVSVDTVNSNLLCKIEGLVRNGVNAGTLAVRFAAETTGTVKVMTGSVLRYCQVS